jgi:heme exporter protein B
VSFWRQVLAVTGKDILAELRSREVLSSVLVFALLVLVVFNFAFGNDRATLVAVAPGLLWVAFAFAGVLALNRAFVPEKEENCLEGLMACPAGREVIYAGKMLASLTFMLITEAVVLPVFALLFNVPVLSLPVIVITLLATLGFVAVGTLFAALAINTRARDMVLPVLFLPIVTPVIIGAVEATGLTLGGSGWGGLGIWLLLLLAFDIIFLVVPFFIFPFAIEE